MDRDVSRLVRAGLFHDAPELFKAVRDWLLTDTRDAKIVRSRSRRGMVLISRQSCASDSRRKRPKVSRRQTRG